MPELGRAALALCLGLALYALVAGAYAAKTRRRRLARSAQNALLAAFAATAAASIVLLAALLRNDFSFTYVAEHTSRELPTPYTISAFWGGQEGSLLLWLLILTGFSAAAVAAQPADGAGPPHVGRPGPRPRRDVLRLHARRRLEPVRHAGRSCGRRRAQPEPPEPVHDDPPALPLSGLRRAHDPVRVRDGRAARRAARTSSGSSPRAAGRSSRGRRSGSASSSARTGPTSKWGGAATTRGIPSRTPR